MKNECSIIRDILPLYIEHMVSDDTAAFVDEHLEQCAKCHFELKNLEKTNRPVFTADKQDSGILPLKAIKKRWQRKKALLVCSSILSTIAVLCCVLFAVEHFVYQEKITVNGAVYTQKGDAVMELPPNSKELGYLRGISHRSTADPMGNFMATNLDEKYGGCPIYQCGADSQVIYLEDYRGFYIPFELTDVLSPQVDQPF